MPSRAERPLLLSRSRAASIPCERGVTLGAASMDRIVRNFKIVEQIGNGTTGIVHKAIQLALDRTVALKELHGHLARDADFIRRFEREAKTAATLSHENILSVIDFGKEGDAYFIALEYVDGADLKHLMEAAPG